MAGSCHAPGVKVGTCARRVRGQGELTEEQLSENRRISKVRVRIEHIFGFMEMSMRGLTVRTIGMRRAVFNIGLTNLVYNLCRAAFLVRERGQVL